MVTSLGIKEAGTPNEQAELAKAMKVVIPADPTAVSRESQVFVRFKYPGAIDIFSKQTKIDKLAIGRLRETH